MSVASCMFQPPTLARPEDGHNRWLKVAKLIIIQ